MVDEGQGVVGEQGVAPPGDRREVRHVVDRAHSIGGREGTERGQLTIW